MKNRNKKNAGTTLVELMVYMVVALIVVTASLKVISRSTTGYMHTRAVTKAQYSARDGLSAMSRDIASMGYKTYFQYDQNNTPTRKYDKICSTDSTHVGNNRHLAANQRSVAAFFFVDGGTNASDTLEFFRIRINDRGERIARERIKYYLNEDNDTNSVVRQLWTFKQSADSLKFDDWGDPEITHIASNVVALNFRFSADGINWMSDNLSGGTTDRRAEMCNVEIAMLVKGYKKQNAQYGQDSYTVGDRIFDASGEKNFIYRLYSQTVEIPNNAKGIID